MLKQLDILALEPFFGGARRSMLEIIIRCSRHRWTLLKLPPRRIERRLAAAAHWFAEQLSRHSVGHFDLLFTSEAMNLADFYRVMPALADKPSVVYFHDNQLPDPSAMSNNPALDFANLNTAIAASEIWFNSKYHVRVFLAELSALIAVTEELATNNPIEPLTRKIRFIPPPVDVSLSREMPQPVQREPRDVFIEMHGANVNLLNAALSILQRRGENIRLLTSGPAQMIMSEIPRINLHDDDLVAETRGLMQATAYVSTKIGATFDEQAVRALALGCRVVLPRAGVYPELLPRSMHGFGLYDVDADSLASRIQDALRDSEELPGGTELEQSLRRFDPISFCKTVDEHLSDLAQRQTAKRTSPV